MKVALAQFIYESNTFNPQEADIDGFTHHGIWLTEPAAIRQWAAASESQLAGSLDELAKIEAETEPFFVAVCGTPGGRLSHQCYQTIRATFAHCLQRALPADTLVLHLHGAVCAAGLDDVEGDLLSLIRQEIGFTGRVIVSLDLHANVTPLMLEHVNVLTAYRTFPHQDFYETGQRSALLSQSSSATVRTLAKIPVLIPPTATDHRSGHFADLLLAARTLESSPGIIDVSLFPVQPWLDIDGLSTTVVVTSTSAEAGTDAARRLAEHWFATRQTWTTGLLDWPEILTRLASPSVLPWLLVDTADATTGGSDGRSADAIINLWPQRHDLPGEVLLWVVDPAAVSAFLRQETTVNLGSPQFPVTAEIVFSGECRFSPRGQAYQGQEFSCGHAIVLRSGRLSIVVTEQGCLCADPAFYECLGLDPQAALAVQVKSHMGWQAGYEVGPERGLRFDGPGCTSLNFARLPYSGLRRDLFPLTPIPLSPIELWQSISPAKSA